MKKILLIVMLFISTSCSAAIFNENVDVNGILTATGIETDPVNDPNVKFNVSTTGDSDWWIGVSSDNDGVADGSDVFKIGIGETAFDKTRLTIGTNGSLTFGDNTSTQVVYTFDMLDVGDLTWTATGYGTAGFATSKMEGCDIGSDTSTRYCYDYKASFGSAYSGSPFKVGLNSEVSTWSSTSNARVMAVRGYTGMTNTSGNGDNIYGVYGSGSKTGAGTVANFYGVYGKSAGGSEASNVTKNWAGGFEGPVQVKGCMMYRDSDDSGWTECNFLDGVMSCSIDTDGKCDGS